MDRVNLTTQVPKISLLNFLKLPLKKNENVRRKQYQTTEKMKRDD